MEAQISFSSQNSLSKKIKCLDVFVWNLGLGTRIAFRNVSKHALNVSEVVWLCERKLKIRNGNGKRWKVEVMMRE